MEEEPQHVLGEHAVIPRDRGLFLSETRRLQPDLCRYVSQAFYESQLRPHASTVGQGVSSGSRLGSGAGLLFIPVEHDHRAARWVSAARRRLMRALNAFCQLLEASRGIAADARANPGAVPL